MTNKINKKQTKNNLGLSIKELDKLEKEIVKEFEAGKFVKAKNEKKIMEQLLKIADNYSKKDKSITLRINQIVLRKVKAKALEKGVPYQTLLSNLINQYASN